MNDEQLLARRHRRNGNGANADANANDPQSQTSNENTSNNNSSNNNSNDEELEPTDFELLSLATLVLVWIISKRSKIRALDPIILAFRTSLDYIKNAIATVAIAFKMPRVIFTFLNRITTNSQSRLTLA